MALPKLQIRRSSVPGKIPSNAQLSLGELALNTYDGKVFLKRNRDGEEKVIGIGSEEPGKSYFVNINGSDTNDGKSVGGAFSTLKKALTIATSGDTIEIGPGTYTEIFPLEVPTGVCVVGAGLRSTFIQPSEATKDKDAFLLNGETEVSDLTVGNFFYNTTNDTGYGFRFKSGMKTTTRSPYVQRVTVLNKGSVTSSSDPYGFDTVNNPPVSYKSGRGAKIDGGVVDATTLEPAMFFNECTFICPNNTGLVMTNGARTEWVNCFTYFCDKSIDAYDGATGLGGVGKTRLKVSGLNVSTTPVSNDTLYYLELFSRTGTYSRTGTTVTITQNSHGLSNGDRIYADFTSGTATDGFYTISNVTTNTFTVTDSSSGATSGNINFKKAIAYGTISSYNSGEIILTNKGTGLFQIASATGGKTVLPSGNAQLSTTQKKFGTASFVLDGTGDYVTIDSNSDFNLGTNNWTIEFWVHPTVSNQTAILFDMRPDSTQGFYPTVFLNGGVITYFTDTGNRITGSSVPINTWSHIAVVKSSGSTKLYVNGVQSGSTYTDTNTYLQSRVRIGVSGFNGASGFTGYIDELRFSDIARYTNTFTPSSTAFVSDGNDKLLLHFDGINGSTSFVDSSISSQDIRFVSGTTTIATATKFTLADYQQFGASMRSIGSASVFGNQGVVGDGPGVVLRLFAYNFGHIGSGKDFSQDETLVIQENEVIETNNADIQYVSIDQSGDFRVGEAFYVSQNDGTVNFGGQDFTLNSLSDLNITDGVTTTTITPNTITVGNLQLTGNNINTTSGNLTIDPGGSGSTTINGDVSINGTLTATTASLGGIIQGDTQVAITDTGSNGTISLIADGTTVQTVKSNSVSFAQNVGIGITNPTEKLHVNGKIKINDSVVINNCEIQSGPIIVNTSTVQFTADSFSATAYRSTKYLIEVRQTSTSNFYTTEILLMHDGTEVYLTQYGTLQTSVSPVSSIDADINSGNVRLLITPSVANTTTKISRISLTA